MAGREVRHLNFCMALRELHLAEKVFSGTWRGKNVTFVNSKKKKNFKASLKSGIGESKEFWLAHDFSLLNTARAIEPKEGSTSLTTSLCQIYEKDFNIPTI